MKSEIKNFFASEATNIAMGGERTDYRSGRRTIDLVGGGFLGLSDDQISVAGFCVLLLIEEVIWFRQFHKIKNKNKDNE